MGRRKVSILEERLDATRIRQKMRKALHRVLVDGWSYAEAGREAGVTRQAVRGAALRFQEQHYKDLTHVPRKYSKKYALFYQYKENGERVMPRDNPCLMKDKSSLKRK